MRILPIIMLIFAAASGVIAYRDEFQCYSCNDWLGDEDCARPLEDMPKDDLEARYNPGEPVPSCTITFLPVTEDGKTDRISDRGMEYLSNDAGQVKIPKDPSSYICYMEEGVENCNCFANLCNAKLPDCRVRAVEEARCTDITADLPNNDLFK